MMLDLRTYQEQMTTMGAQVPYVVQFFFEQKPQLEAAQLLERLRSDIGRVETAEMQDGVTSFAFLDHMVRFREGSVPVQCMLSAVTVVDQPVSLLEGSLMQTWDWPQAAQVAGKAACFFSVTDMMAGGLDRKLRLDLVHRVTSALLELLPSTLLLHWLPSQRIVEPAAYLEGIKHGGLLYTGALNVRMFRVEGPGEELVMDTMGLLPFGISDLQCHFTGLQPRDIGLMLLNMAEFLFEKGEVFKDGDTVEGLKPTDKWTCRHEMALVEPRRQVIDIHPGEFAPPD